MSEFLKLAWELIAKVIYNVTDWLFGFVMGFIHVFITGWVEYYAIFMSYFVNFSWPMTRNTGKYAMPLPRWLNSAPNTAHMTRQVSSGLRMLHATPSTLRRYFSLKSRVMRFCRR